MDKEKFLKEVGEKLYILRKQNNLTQSDFNMKSQQFARYENGENVMGILTLKEICEKLNISSDYLLGLPNEFEKLPDEKKVNYLMMKKLSHESDLRLTGMLLAMLEMEKNKEKK